MSEPGSEDRFGTLMRAAQGGDQAAYAELLTELAPRLRQFARGRYRFLRPADVEDLVQEVLLSVHAVRATYDPRRPFMPWLLAITRNRMVDGVRRYARQSAHEMAVDDLAVTFEAQAANTPLEEFGDPDALRQAIEHLPAGQRSAIELLKLQEMSLKDAAAATGMSIGALKVATHRAIRALQKILKP